MGVMTCSVLDCRNTGCDTYIGEIGYICGDCQETFKKYVLSDYDGPLETNDEIKDALRYFVNEGPQQKNTFDLSFINEFFKQHTE